MERGKALCTEYIEFFLFPLIWMCKASELKYFYQESLKDNFDTKIAKKFIKFQYGAMNNSLVIENHVYSQYFHFRSQTHK